MREHKERKTLARYLCQVSLSLKVPKFHSATALQHCKLLLADFSPPYHFNCLLACSFHLQFPQFEIGFCPLLSVQHKSCGMNDCPIQTRLGISSGNSPDPIQLFEQMQTLVYRQVEAESLFLLLERCHFHSRPIHVSSLSAFQAPLHRRCPLDVLTPAC